MARPLYLDLRERVVAAALSGKSCRTVAATFGVSVASVVKWTQRYRATGSASPGKMGGHRPCLLAGERAFLLARLAEEPDISMRALADERPRAGSSSATFGVEPVAAGGPDFQKKRARQRAGSP